MGVFKEMDPELARAAIEGHKDLLGPESNKLEQLYRQFRCPRCRTELQKEFDAHHVFSDPSVMSPRALLRCPTCNYLIDPHHNLVVEYGDASKIPLESVPIIEPED